MSYKTTRKVSDAHEEAGPSVQYRAGTLMDEDEVRASQLKMTSKHERELTIRGVFRPAVPGRFNVSTIFRIARPHGIRVPDNRKVIMQRSESDSSFSLEDLVQTLDSMSVFAQKKYANFIFSSYFSSSAQRRLSSSSTSTASGANNTNSPILAYIAQYVRKPAVVKKFDMGCASELCETGACPVLGPITERYSQENLDEFIKEMAEEVILPARFYKRTLVCQTDSDYYGFHHKEDEERESLRKFLPPVTPDDCDQSHSLQDWDRKFGKNIEIPEEPRAQHVKRFFVIERLAMMDETFSEINEELNMAAIGSPSDHDEASSIDMDCDIEGIPFDIAGMDFEMEEEPSVDAEHESDESVIVREHEEECSSILGDLEEEPLPFADIAGDIVDLRFGESEKKPLVLRRLSDVMKEFDDDYVEESLEDADFEEEVSILGEDEESFEDEYEESSFVDEVEEHEYPLNGMKDYSFMKKPKRDQPWPVGQEDIFPNVIRELFKGVCERWEEEKIHVSQHQWVQAIGDFDI